MAETKASSISSLVTAESRRFPPDPEFAARAHVPSLAHYQEMYDRSVNDPDGFWLEQAKTGLTWFKEPTKGREHTWDTDARIIDIKWFADGELNVSVNCLDRHLDARGNKPAIVWQGEPDEDQTTLTYSELHRAVCQFANVLKG